MGAGDGSRQVKQIEVKATRWDGVKSDKAAKDLGYKAEDGLRQVKQTRESV